MEKAFIGTFFSNRKHAEEYAKKRGCKLDIVSAGSDRHFVMSLRQFNKLK